MFTLSILLCYTTVWELKPSTQLSCVIYSQQTVTQANKCVRYKYCHVFKQLLTTMISNMHEITRKIRDLDYLTQSIQLYIFNLHDDRGPEDDVSSVDTYCLRNNLVKIHTIHSCVDHILTPTPY